MQVGHKVRLRQHFARQPGCDALPERTVRVAWEVAVQVLSVLRHDGIRHLRHTAIVHAVQKDHRTRDLLRPQRGRRLGDRRHSGVFPAVDARRKIQRLARQFAVHHRHRRLIFRPRDGHEALKLFARLDLHAAQFNRISHFVSLK